MLVNFMMEVVQSGSKGVQHLVRFETPGLHGRLFIRDKNDVNEGAMLPRGHLYGMFIDTPPVAQRLGQLRATTVAMRDLRARTCRKL